MILQIHVNKASCNWTVALSWKKFIIFYEPKPAVNRSVLHLTDNRKSAPVKNGFQASLRELQLRLRQAAQQKVSLHHETGFLSLLIDYCRIFLDTSLG